MVPFPSNIEPFFVFSPQTNSHSRCSDQTRGHFHFHGTISFQYRTLFCIFAADQRPFSMLGSNAWPLPLFTRPITAPDHSPSRKPGYLHSIKTSLDITTHVLRYFHHIHVPPKTSTFMSCIETCFLYRDSFLVSRLDSFAESKYDIIIRERMHVYNSCSKSVFIRKDQL